MKLAFQTQITETRATDVEGVGRLRYENDKVYRWVKNSSSGTLALGATPCHAFSDGANMFEQVRQSATANLALLAGVVTVTAGIATVAYGWIQILGYNAAVGVFQSQTTVKSLGTILKAANAVDYVDTDVASATAPTLQRNITLLETVATVTTGAVANKKGYINCL